MLVAKGSSPPFADRTITTGRKGVKSPFPSRRSAGIFGSGRRPRVLRRGAWSYQIKDENGQIKTVKEEQPHELKIFETDLGAARGLAAELANEGWGTHNAN
jgi:hypothetical protein